MSSQQVKLNNGKICSSLDSSDLNSSGEGGHKSYSPCPCVCAKDPRTSPVSGVAPYLVSVAQRHLKQVRNRFNLKTAVRKRLISPSSMRNLPSGPGHPNPVSGVRGLVGWLVGWMDGWMDGTDQRGAVMNHPMKRKHQNCSRLGIIFSSVSETTGSHPNKRTDVSNLAPRPNAQPHTVQR